MLIWQQGCFGLERARSPIALIDYRDPMDFLLDRYDLVQFALFGLAVAGVLVGLWIANRLMLGANTPHESRPARQFGMMVLTFIALVIVVLALPVAPETRGQLLSLMGVALTLVIALASTTFAANAMAGLMLRVVENYRPGDWIRVKEEFGRVTERGLFHTEIQTEERDLTTLPNLYIVQNPVKVVRSSGTIVSCELSLGYEQDHVVIEPLLTQAARAAGLEDPFVHIRELGDYSVTYRIAGFLTDVKSLLTARSTLRRFVLDKLHAAKVEIVSPTFMNQRRVDDETMIPETRRPQPIRTDGPTAEAVAFDKADEAEKLETVRKDRAELTAEIKQLKESLTDTAKDERAAVERSIDQKQRRVVWLDERIAELENEKGGE